MTVPRSLQARLGLSIGVLMTVLWVATAVVTAFILQDEMDEVFDSALQETAQRILPLAVVDIVGREVDGVNQRLGALRDHEEFFTYVVRDAQGRVLLQSHAADPSIFPPYAGPGFDQTASHRIYSDAALQGSVRISVAERLEHRRSAAREVQMVLGLPLLVVIPVALLAVILAVRASLAPLWTFRNSLQARSARDLSPLPTADLPLEIIPVAATLNEVLGRLKSAFEAERSFAANAAHELRTPLAGAIAQAQRLQVESKDHAAVQRASEIEAALKRLTRMAERLLQLARAEGGALTLDHASDLRPVARLVVEDVQRMDPKAHITLALPTDPVLSDLDPDAFGILSRNLVENALRHGMPDGEIRVRLDADGLFVVGNDGPVVPAGRLAQLTQRFERGGTDKGGSGLGLAIVAAIAERTATCLVLQSPRPGGVSGFQASIRLPVHR